MEDKIIESVNERTNIVDLVSEFVTLSKKGNNYVGLCPFHSDTTPSFTVNPQRNICKCFSCNEGGGPITFLQKIKKITFNEALGILAERLDIKINKTFVQRPLNAELYSLLKDASVFYSMALKLSIEANSAREYLSKRLINEELVEKFNLGYAPSEENALFNYLVDKGYNASKMIEAGVIIKGVNGKYYDFFAKRLVFPITNIESAIVGFSGRLIRDIDNQPKYLNIKETKIFKKREILYNFSNIKTAFQPREKLYIFEGFFDCISAVKAKIKNSIATMGVSLTSEMALILKKIQPNIVLCYDNDTAGKKAITEALKILKKHHLYPQVLIYSDPLIKDLDQYVSTYGPDKANEFVLNNTVDVFEYLLEQSSLSYDFNNSSDIISFRNELTELFFDVDTTIVEIYKQKVLNKYGFDFEVKTSSPIQTTSQVISFIDKSPVLDDMEPQDYILVDEPFFGEQEMQYPSFQDTPLIKKVNKVKNSRLKPITKSKRWPQKIIIFEIGLFRDLLYNSEIFEHASVRKEFFKIATCCDATVSDHIGSIIQAARDRNALGDDFVQLIEWYRDENINEIKKKVDLSKNSILVDLKPKEFIRRLKAVKPYVALFDKLGLAVNYEKALNQLEPEYQNIRKTHS